jgi:plasmid stabilization system protein ParE
MLYNIVWAGTALQDLDDIYEWISFDSVTAAGKITNALFDTTLRLKTNPLLGIEEKKLKHRKQEYRYIIYGNYKVVYRTEEDIIYVIKVFDTRRDPEDLFDRYNRSLTK